MEKEKIYTAIIKNLPLGFSIVDKEGVIVDFNTAAERITGYSKDEVIGKSHLEILHGTSDRDACPLFKETLLKHKQSIETENIIKKKSGGHITKSVTTFPLFDDNGNFMGGVEIFRDITEFKRLERERKNFLSMFAHDMKNPVVTAGGFLARLISGKVGDITDKQLEYFEVIRNELNILETLITDFLTFSRLESADYKPVPCPFNIELSIEKHIETSKIEAEKKNIEIRSEYPEDISPVITADAPMITRVIANLLDNAIKYTKHGGTITVSLSDRDKDICVRVIDTGIGIPEDQLPYIFDAFYRIGRDSRGSGLGLSITKKIMEAHGGRIWVESSDKKGSTFSFTLPKKAE